MCEISKFEEFTVKTETLSFSFRFSFSYVLTHLRKTSSMVVTEAPKSLMPSSSCLFSRVVNSSSNLHVGKEKKIKLFSYLYLFILISPQQWGKCRLFFTSVLNYNSLSVINQKSETNEKKSASKLP